VKIVGTTASGSGGKPLTEEEPKHYGTANEDEVIRNEIAVEGGFAFAVWEWVSDDPASEVSSDEVFFGITIRSQNVEKDSGFLRVFGDIGPLSTHGTSHILDDKVALPRFVEVGYQNALELDPTPVRL
jgi:hypothetical protein